MTAREYLYIVTISALTRSPDAPTFLSNRAPGALQRTEKGEEVRMITVNDAAAEAIRAALADRTDEPVLRVYFAGHG
jgi:hypothetical protein